MKYYIIKYDNTLDIHNEYDISFKSEAAEVIKEFDIEELEFSLECTETLDKIRKMLIDYLDQPELKELKDPRKLVNILRQILYPNLLHE